MDFIEVVEGFSIRKESIVSVKTMEEGKILIQTENRDFLVYADFSLVMQALEEEGLSKQRVAKVTSQYFGG